MRIVKGYPLIKQSEVKSQILLRSKKDYACIHDDKEIIQEVVEQDLSIQINDTVKKLDIAHIKDSENINNYFQLGIFKVNLFISKNSVFKKKFLFKDKLVFDDKIKGSNSLNLIEEFDMSNNCNTYLLNKNLETKQNIKLVDKLDSLEDSHTVILLNNIKTDEYLLTNLTSKSTITKLVLNKINEDIVILNSCNIWIENGLLPLRYINKNELKDLEKNYNEYSINSEVSQIRNFMEKNGINSEEDLLNYIKENGNILVDYYGKSILKSIEYSELNKLDNLKVEEIIDEYSDEFLE